MGNGADFFTCQRMRSCRMTTESVAVFFMSDDSKFVTAQTLAVDGGWSLSDGQYDRPAGKGH